MSPVYLADVFNHLNYFNTSIQGTAMNINTTSERIPAFANKLSIWISNIGLDKHANFPQLHENSNGKISLPVVLETNKNICKFRQSFHGYFQPGEVSVSQAWMQDPLIFNQNP